MCAGWTPSLVASCGRLPHCMPYEWALAGSQASAPELPAAGSILLALGPFKGFRHWPVFLWSISAVIKSVRSAIKYASILMNKVSETVVIYGLLSKRVGKDRQLFTCARSQGLAAVDIYLGTTLPSTSGPWNSLQRLVHAKTKPSR